MKTRKECDPLSDKAIQFYVAVCECGNPDNLRSALELLIAKAARALEKYCGHAVAVAVLKRTMKHLDRNPSPTH